MLVQNYKKIGDSYHYVTDGNLVNEATGEISTGIFALKQIGLDEYLSRGQGTKFCQFHKLVLPGLISARHIFKGLRRGLYNDDDPDSDQANLVYTWKPGFDIEWEGGVKGKPADRPPPAGAVFAVIVSPNLKHKQNYPEVDCFIGAWNWLAEDKVLAEAPIEWVDRYDRKLWTRSDK